MGAGCSHRRFHFLQCEIFPHAFGRLVLLFWTDGLQRIRRQYAVTHGFVQRTVQNCLMMMCCTVADDTAILAHPVLRIAQKVDEATAEVHIHVC